MADPPKRARKPLSEDSRKRKRDRDRERGKNRINIGPAFPRWRALLVRTACTSDADLAVMLMNRYETQEVTSTPNKRLNEIEAPSPPPVSAATEGSGVKINIEGIQQACSEKEIDVLESSMHFMSMAQEVLQDCLKEVDLNNLRNNIVEINRCCDPGEDSPEKDGDSSDEDFFPHLCLRPSLAKSKELIQQLHNISLDEAVIDRATTNELDEEIQTTPKQPKVLCEEDLVGKSACIVYVTDPGLPLPDWPSYALFLGSGPWTDPQSGWLATSARLSTPAASCQLSGREPQTYALSFSPRSLDP